MDRPTGTVESRSVGSRELANARRLAVLATRQSALGQQGAQGGRDIRAKTFPANPDGPPRIRRTDPISTSGRRSTSGANCLCDDAFRAPGDPLTPPVSFI